MPPRTAQMVVLLTGFIAFISILVAGMLAIRLDRTRDVLDRSARTLPALAVPLSGTSRALAVLAGAVEHLPLIPSGERRQTFEHAGPPA